jgi:hypothetical protein
MHTSLVTRLLRDPSLWEMTTLDDDAAPAPVAHESLTDSPFKM